MAQNEILNKTEEIVQDTTPNIGLHLYSETFMYLGLVVGLIILLALLVKKFNKNAFRKSKEINIIDSVSVGQKEKIVLLEINNKRLLIGVTQHSINYLDICEPNSSESLKNIDYEKEKSEKTFKQILSSIKQVATSK